QGDIPIKEARKITPEDFIIGVSTHSLEQAKKAEADGADYIGIGPVFATPTKEDYSPIGVDTVKSVLGAISIPAVAIGGINLDNLDQLKTAGAVNVAMVRQFASNTCEVIKIVNKNIANI
ncbi:MAG: thiamine phosphate synthase, partial [candidate division Zixibacteria bacterium]|nr:thiamine phosphate synthase [candidate division Zixibacteria bacterium]